MYGPDSKGKEAPEMRICHDESAERKHTVNRKAKDSYDDRLPEKMRPGKGSD